ncbi:MAG: RNA polymerase sigma factor [Flavobacteriaceae bacterium]|nr:RNA polymerase sigma factor [Flavobacteriaceae bacterium]
MSLVATVEKHLTSAKINKNPLESQETDIQNLINKAIENDQKAFDILLNTFWSDIYRFQLSKNESIDEAEDITIKTFSKAFDKINSYDTNYDFKNWLLTISNRIFIDHTRKQKARTISIDKKEVKAYQFFDETPSIEDRLIKEQNLDELLLHLKKLKPHYKEIIELRYFKELSYKQIAQKLNEPLSNVKVKLSRAKKLLTTSINSRQ